MEVLAGLEDVEVLLCDVVEVDDTEECLADALEVLAETELRVVDDGDEADDDEPATPNPIRSLSKSNTV